MAIVRRDPFREIEHWEPFGWQPFREMESLQREMNRLFDRLMPGHNGGNSAIAFMPSAEIEETAEDILLKLEIPGLEPKDLDVKVTEDSVSISGERRSEVKSEEKGMMRSEFHYGKFERVIPLSTHIQSDGVQAEYKNGILTLTMPKAEAEKTKVVKVEVA
ncbi:MAG: Hsp20/alpha crystallin family protein [Cyanothece sp. SIO1E1]|nr:Hsp20/alpha crystallin family protein [Cyanothece sp. SIO1E1]